jgi:hypothetical protein
MKHKFALVVGVLAATGLALPALASDQHSNGAQMQGQQGKKHGKGQQGMMHGAQGGMMGGQMGSGMMGDQAGMMQMMMKMHSQMRGMHGQGMMGNDWRAVLDADGDGKLSEAEVTEGLKARMEAHDADGDGNLSIDEFEALHSSMIRETMVDRFQHFDANGDGSVTPAEIEKGTKQKAGKHGMMGGMAMPDAKAGETKKDN